MTDAPVSISPSRPVETPRRVRLLVMLPLLGFFAVAVLFAARLAAGDPSLLPSPLIGKSAPQFALAPLDGLVTSGPPGLSTADLKTGHVTLVNVFASWCDDCHLEHEALMALSHDPALQAKGIRMTGIVYKDDPENARSYLGAKGNPFSQVGADRSGRTAIDLGVYGVPETFVVKGDGTIAYKLIGGVTEATRPALMAAIAKAEQ